MTPPEELTAPAKNAHFVLRASSDATATRLARLLQNGRLPVRIHPAQGLWRDDAGDGWQVAFRAE